MIAIEVTDTGPTLSQEQLDALFERPNRNGDHDAARGLGLYIATRDGGGRGRTDRGAIRGRQARD